MRIFYVKTAFFSIVFTLFLIINSIAQVVTKEDSLNAGLTKPVPGQNTVISGYGQGQYQRNLRLDSASANLPRIVMFIGHRFNRNISFFSELEVEDVKVEGGQPGGEIAMEQAFLKFNLNRDMYLVTGLFLPRIGIINENHLPTTFNGNERTIVETILIPSTWREIGVGLYGTSRRLTGLNYNIALVNGLSSQGFGVDGLGIREGRWEGKNAVATNLAVTGALLYYIGGFRIQTSMYYGGSTPFRNSTADTLHLHGGAFGSPVLLNEANVQFRSKGFVIKALAVRTNIKDAASINNAFGNNSPGTMLGAYIEVGYNLLALAKDKEKFATKSVVIFSRYETLNLNYKVPVNGVKDTYLNQQHWISGITYMPVRGVVIKADYRYSVTGNAISGVSTIPPGPFYTNKGFINLGFGYSF